MPNIEIPEENVDPHLKWIVKSGFFVFGGIILSKLMVYAYRVIIARVYGPEAYGLFSLALMVSSWIIAFASLGLIDGILRYVALYRGKNNYQKIAYLVKTGSKILIYTSVLSGIVSYLLSEFIAVNIFHNPDLTIYLKIFSIGIPFYILATFYLGVLKGFEKIQWYSFILNILQNVSRVGILVFLIFLGLNANSIGYSYIISVILIFICAYLVCKIKIPEIFIKRGKNIPTNNASDKKALHSLFSYSWPLIFLGAVYSIMYWADSFVIGYYKDAFTVGIYNAAIPLCSILNISADLFAQAFVPLVTKEYSRGNTKVVGKISKQINKWIVIINLPIFIIMIFFPGAVINLFFGREYLAAANSLRLVTIGSMLITCMFAISNNLLYMKGKSKIILGNIVLTTAINIILSIILIKYYGIVGVAMGAMIGSIILSILAFIECIYYTKINPLKKDLIKIILISLIPTVLLVIFKNMIPLTKLNVVLIGFSYLVIYVIMLIITKCFDENDIMIIKAIKKKIFG